MGVLCDRLPRKPTQKSTLCTFIELRCSPRGRFLPPCFFWRPLRAPLRPPRGAPRSSAPICPVPSVSGDAGCTDRNGRKRSITSGREGCRGSRTLLPANSLPISAATWPLSTAAGNYVPRLRVLNETLIIRTSFVPLLPCAAVAFRGNRCGAPRCPRGAINSRDYNNSTAA